MFNFDGKGEIVGRLMTYDYYGYPRDFLQTYQKSVERVTVEDVRRAAAKHVHPEELAVLAVGRDDDFDAPLSTLGEVRAIDITIPSPAGVETPPPGTGDAALGGELLIYSLSFHRRFLQEEVVPGGDLELVRSLEAQCVDDHPCELKVG